MNKPRIILAAHRGDKFNFPENTMPAFRATQDAGLDMIETDLHLTRDGHLVIMHDRSALRTAGVDRNLDEMTLDEVRELDAGYLFDPKFKGEKVPTVIEFLEWIRDTELHVNWELKDYPYLVGDEHAFAAADKLIELIEQYGMGERSIINSFSARVLEHIYRQHGHKYPIHGQGIYLSPRSKDTVSPDINYDDMMDWCCLYPIDKEKSVLEYKELFEYCHERGIRPCLLLPDTEENYQKAIDLGCTMFTSNNILEADRILKKLGYR